MIDVDFHLRVNSLLVLKCTRRYSTFLSQANGSISRADQISKIQRWFFDFCRLRRSFRRSCTSVSKGQCVFRRHLERFWCHVSSFETPRPFLDSWPSPIDAFAGRAHLRQARRGVGPQLLLAEHETQQAKIDFILVDLIYCLDGSIPFISPHSFATSENAHCLQGRALGVLCATVERPFHCNPGAVGFALLVQLQLVDSD